MEHGAFEDQIFSDFSGPLSPLGSKPLTPSASIQTSGGHSIHSVMLGMPAGSVVQHANSGELCAQRLPECNTLLQQAGAGGGGGSPKLDPYKTTDYVGHKMDFIGSVNKLGCYSPTPKYEYITTQKLESHAQHQHHHHHHSHTQQQQYSPPSSNGMNGGHPKHIQHTHHHQSPILSDYHSHGGSNGKIDYSPNSAAKLEYEHHLQQMYGGSPHHITHHDGHVVFNGDNGVPPTCLSTPTNSIIGGNNAMQTAPMPATSGGSSDGSILLNGGSNGSNNGGNATSGKCKKSDDLCEAIANNNSGGNGANGGGATPTTVSSAVSATSTVKKNEKKKGDPNGIKKKKTR